MPTYDMHASGLAVANSRDDFGANIGSECSRNSLQLEENDLRK